MVKKLNFVQRTVLKAVNYVLSLEQLQKNAPSLPARMSNAQLPQYYIAPLQLQRLAHDIKAWREAVAAAENAWYPERYYMQRMYVDVILDGHTQSCIKKRKSLSLLKDYIICNEKGAENEELTKLFKDKQWFRNLLNYILDAQFYGYSLIQLGDLMVKGKNYNFPRLLNLRRWNVSPDRQNLVSIPLQKTGINFLDPTAVDDNGVPYADWMVYVDTPTDIGHSICGYGLLYNVALYAIYLRNNLSGNADYTQMFSTPYRHATTAMKLNEDEEKKLEEALAAMGGNGYVITDDGVKLTFHESNSGNGYKSYESLEQRCEKKISKLILGHSDAMDSVPGKLGATQGDNSPIEKAIAATEKEQDAFLLDVLNNTVLPKLRVLGFPVPEGMMFGVTNDKEEQEARCKKDEANKKTADIAQTMKNAGLRMNAAYFEERTGIPTEEMEMEGEGQKEEEEEEKPEAKVAKRIKNKLNKIYSHSH